MNIEKLVTDIFINLINAILVPLVLPVFNFVLNKEKVTESRTDTGTVHLTPSKFGKPKKTSDIDEKITFRNELPAAYFANLVWAVVYMYSNNFRSPFIIVYYTLIVISLILIVFVTRDFSEIIKKRIITWTGIILILFSLIIIFCPLKFNKLFLKDTVSYSQSLTESSTSGDN